MFSLPQSTEPQILLIHSSPVHRQLSISVSIPNSSESDSDLHSWGRGTLLTRYFVWKQAGGKGITKLILYFLRKNVYCVYCYPKPCYTVGLSTLRNLWDFRPWRGKSHNRQAFPINPISLSTQNLLLTSALRRPTASYCSRVCWSQYLLQALLDGEMWRI